MRVWISIGYAVEFKGRWNFGEGQGRIMNTNSRRSLHEPDEVLAQHDLLISKVDRILARDSFRPFQRGALCSDPSRGTPATALPGAALRR
jgi:hypothetical protein